MISTEPLEVADMTSHGDFSPEARERADRTAAVAAIFGDHAELIVSRLPDVPDGSVLVAVVDRDHVFAGTHNVGQAELPERVPQLEADGGWAMVFSYPSTVADVRRRAADFAATARKRAEVIDRIAARRADAEG
jgi:hypothetical protein